MAEAHSGEELFTCMYICTRCGQKVFEDNKLKKLCFKKWSYRLKSKAYFKAPSLYDNYRIWEYIGVICDFESASLCMP